MIIGQIWPLPTRLFPDKKLNDMRVQKCLWNNYSISELIHEHYDIISHHITSHHTSHHITLHLISSHLITSHHITHHITSHYTSHLISSHIIAYHIIYHIISYHITTSKVWIKSVSYLSRSKYNKSPICTEIPIFQQNERLLCVSNRSCWWTWL